MENQKPEIPTSTSKDLQTVEKSTGATINITWKLLLAGAGAIAAAFGLYFILKQRSKKSSMDVKDKVQSFSF